MRLKKKSSSIIVIVSPAKTSVDETKYKAEKYG